MKILIDATPLLLKSAGVKGHLYHWIAALRQAAPPGAVQTWPAMRDQKPLDHSRSMGSRLETLLGVGSFVASFKIGFPSYELLLPKADVFHACIMQNSLPRGRRATSTVYDMTPVLFPETHSEENVRSFYVHCEKVLKRCHALAAISEHSRQDAIRLLGIDPRRIVTIPCLIPPAYFEVTGAKAESAKLALGLKRPYVLFVSTIEPRKNVGRLLDAWEQLPENHRDAFELVIAGSAGWRSGDLAARLRSGIRSVRWLGYVAEEHLPGLTAGAELLAYPSLYEGFGLPPGQALAAGVPVLTSNTSSLPEVVGPGGVMVDPLSVAEIASALRRLLDDAGLRRELGALGRQHVAERFTPGPIGAASVRFFENACG